MFISGVFVMVRCVCGVCARLACDVKVVGLIRFSTSRTNEVSDIQRLLPFFRGWRAFTAHFHVTALRNSYEINEIKVIFLFVLCLFYLGLFLFAFLFYKLFYYYQVFDCISASFVDVFSIRTFHITSHSSFHSLILRAPKAFSHRQRSTK